MAAPHSRCCGPPGPRPQSPGGAPLMSAGSGRQLPSGFRLGTGAYKWTNATACSALSLAFDYLQQAGRINTHTHTHTHGTQHAQHALHTLTHLSPKILTQTMTSPRSVKISATATCDKALISVADTGVGISPERLPHIFKPFDQARLRTAVMQGSPWGSPPRLAGGRGGGGVLGPRLRGAAVPFCARRAHR